METSAYVRVMGQVVQKASADGSVYGSMSSEKLFIQLQNDIFTKR